MVTKTKTKYVNKNKFKKRIKKNLVKGGAQTSNSGNGTSNSGNGTGNSGAPKTPVAAYVSRLFNSKGRSYKNFGRAVIGLNRAQPTTPSAKTAAIVVNNAASEKDASGDNGSVNSTSSSLTSSFKTTAPKPYNPVQKDFNEFSSKASSTLSSLTNSIKSIGKSEPKEPLISGIPVTQLKSELESLKSLSIDNINLNVSNNEKDLNKKVNDICNEISSKALLLELNKQFYSNLNKFVRAAPKNNEKIYGEKILGKNKNLNFMLFNKLIHGKTDNWPPIEQRDSLNSELSIKGKNMMSKFFGSNNNKSKKSKNESNTSEKKGGKIIIKRKRKFLKKK